MVEVVQEQQAGVPAARNPALLPNILVTGTPGVGKTSLCSLLES